MNECSLTSECNVSDFIEEKCYRVSSRVDEKQNQKSNFLLIANHKPLISKGGTERAQNLLKFGKIIKIAVFHSLGRLAIKAHTSNKNQRAFSLSRNIKS